MPPNPKSTFKSNRRSNKYKSLSASSPRAEATTYTRLPPKEDFSAPSFDVSEVKISGSDVAKFDASGNSSSLGEELDTEDEVDGQRLNYDQFSVFDGELEIFFDPNGEMMKVYDFDGVRDENGGEMEDGEDELEVKERGPGEDAARRKGGGRGGEGGARDSGPIGGDWGSVVGAGAAGQRAMLIPGGRGGRGNASFESGNNKVPRIAENGEAGHEMWLDLELKKLVADVGIASAPTNAGKGTLLSVISAAQLTIANYPFTHCFLI